MILPLPLFTNIHFLYTNQSFCMYSVIKINILLIINDVYIYMYFFLVFSKSIEIITNNIEFKNVY